MKVLWLCSWYPNAADPFDGDFIERQAKALSLLQPVDIIHVVQNPNLVHLHKKFEKEYSHQPHNVKICFVPAAKTFSPFLNKLLFNRRYQKVFISSIQEYIQENGKPDIVHVQVPVKAGYGALWLQKKYGTPFVVTEHYNIYHTDGKQNFNSYSSYFRYLTSSVFQSAQKIITVSNYLGKSINEFASKRVCTVVPNVVDTTFFKYEPGDKKNQKFKFLHVSSLNDIKNPQLMLAAIHLFLKTNEEAEFVFIGNKDDYWEQKATAIGIAKKNIRFMGEMSYPDIAAQMKCANAFFLFSRSETFSCATAEALCCGLPVIAPSAGALPELLNETNAVIVPPGDVQAFAAALHRVKNEYNKFNRVEISKAASAKYNYETVALQIQQIYEEVLNTVR